MFCAQQKSTETCKGSRVVRVMWSRCLSHLSLCLFLGLCQQEGSSPPAALAGRFSQPKRGFPLVIFTRQRSRASFCFAVRAFLRFSPFVTFDLQCQCTRSKAEGASSGATSPTGLSNGRAHTHFPLAVVERSLQSSRLSSHAADLQKIYLCCSADNFHIGCSLAKEANPR